MPEARALEPVTDPLRSRLGDIIGRVQAQQTTLTGLEAGQERAHASLREAEHALSDARAALQQAERAEPARLAADFVNGQTDADPVGDAALVLSAAGSEVTRLERVETALAGEVARVQGTLRALKVTQYSVMAEIVVGSEEYAALIEQHTLAWKNLRTVKEALRAVVAGLHGAMPQRWMDEINRSEPLDPRLGYEVDQNLVGGWREAIAQLEQDSDAELPLFV